MPVLSLTISYGKWLSTQLAERSLLTPKAQGSNLPVHILYKHHLFTVNSTEKTKIKKKRPGMVR